MVSRETFSRKLSIFVLICALLLPSLFSCGRIEYTDEELLTAAKELIPLSMELNDIYFGEGLPLSADRESVERFYNAFDNAVDSDIKSLNYHPVSKDCKYQTIDQIKSDTALVFSADYCNYLYELAFSGISAVFNEGTEQQITSNASYARYIESDNGGLTVRIDLPYEAMPLNREFDLNSVKIQKKKRNSAIVTIVSYVDGVSEEMDLTFVLTESGFRLDTPTY